MKKLYVLSLALILPLWSAEHPNYSPYPGYVAYPTYPGYVPMVMPVPATPYGFPASTELPPAHYYPVVPAEYYSAPSYVQEAIPQNPSSLIDLDGVHFDLKWEISVDDRLLGERSLKFYDILQKWGTLGVYMGMKTSPTTGLKAVSGFIGGIHPDTHMVQYYFITPSAGTYNKFKVIDQKSIDFINQNLESITREHPGLRNQERLIKILDFCQQFHRNRFIPFNAFTEKQPTLSATPVAKQIPVPAVAQAAASSKRKKGKAVTSAQSDTSVLDDKHTDKNSSEVDQAAMARILHRLSVSHESTQQQSITTKDRAHLDSLSSSAHIHNTSSTPEGLEKIAHNLSTETKTDSQPVTTKDNDNKAAQALLPTTEKIKSCEKIDQIVDQLVAQVAASAHLTPPLQDNESAFDPDLFYADGVVDTTPVHYNQKDNKATTHILEPIIVATCNTESSPTVNPISSSSVIKKNEGKQSTTTPSKLTKVEQSPATKAQEDELLAQAIKAAEQAHKRESLRFTVLKNLIEKWHQQMVELQAKKLDITPIKEQIFKQMRDNSHNPFIDFKYYNGPAEEHDRQKILYQHRLLELLMVTCDIKPSSDIKRLAGLGNSLDWNYFLPSNTTSHSQLKTLKGIKLKDINGKAITTVQHLLEHYDATLRSMDPSYTTSSIFIGQKAAEPADEPMLSIATQNFGPSITVPEGFRLGIKKAPDGNFYGIVYKEKQQEQQT